MDTSVTGIKISELKFYFVKCYSAVCLFLCFYTDCGSLVVMAFSEHYYLEEMTNFVLFPLHLLPLLLRRFF